MPTTRTRQRSTKDSTLTIRIDQDLKDDVIAIAHDAGEDVSSWIRQFFEGVRKRKRISRAQDVTGDDEGEFTEQFVNEVLDADKNGVFKPFHLKDYV